MKKQIRLLIENLFDDEFDDMYNDTDLDIEIANEYIGNYKVGDLIYNDKKKPYAICCGNAEDFNDNRPRFVLINLKYVDLIGEWCLYQKQISKLKHYKCSKYRITDKSSIRHIDENGYENTQIIKNNYNLSDFPAFEYCLNFGDKVYLPAIDELQILCFYFRFNKLPELANNFQEQSYQYKYVYNSKNYLNFCFWSSTQRSATAAIYCNLNTNSIEINFKDCYKYVVLFN